ncbi:MAG: carbamoyl-phosphate synthase large subunit [Planctomycetia bacterium]|nr:carbamoyl-phosphate synthase large subunit [Planctomycetia bacterium]
MPQRTDIKKIMLIGSGPIVIGQGCEFDYSGVQACKVLKSLGYEIVLINSNPATIMTDPDFADRTYIEPLTFETLSEIIRRELPDALLPTLGGQTALNLALELDDTQVLRRHHVELIGVSAEAIRRAEDRERFKTIMTRLGIETASSFSVHTLEEAKRAAEKIGKWPLILRPGFTLGGTGGGIANDVNEFETLIERGLTASLNHEVLIEESLLGWKEFELEVIRDRRNRAVIVCSIENVDPMGIHTGDSITVAPAQTLSDHEYQRMRDDSLRIMEAIGVETGGSNVQWAVDPATGRRVVIEMNPRVSRSSALASKATGFPIAKIAAMLAVGFSLDEIRNDITQCTPACFEPSLDYVVTKFPRFCFEKFPAADSTLGTQMKSVGEAMAIGRTFQQSFQKGLRSLEIGRFGFGADGKDEPFESMSDETLDAELRRPNADRIFVIRAAFRRGRTVKQVNALTGIDSFFLRKMKELVDFEPTVVKTRDSIRSAKKLGYSDRQLAFLLEMSEEEIRTLRHDWGLRPIYGTVDTCAGEFTAPTPYYYSSWDEYDEPIRDSGGKPRIMILGGGPNRIGQGIEFDYCCVHAAFALSAAGFETIMVNSNPETVSTDYDTSDKLYFEPLTLEDVLEIYEREQCNGIIVQFGGQTPLNLAEGLKKAGANILGTAPEEIDQAEDRDFFRELASRLEIQQPSGGIAHTMDEALTVTEKIGYPVLVRPSFVLGGRAMVIVYKEKYLRKYIEEALVVSEGKPILIDRFLENAIELDVDCVSDGTTSVIGAIMEHVEPAGIHSGDSACSIPPRSLSSPLLEKIRRHTLSLAKSLNINGLMNIQFAIKDEEVFILEVNPRASRTIPFASKSTGVPLAKKAALAMVGISLDTQRFTHEPVIPYTTFKEAVFPFVKFPGVDIVLSPEMKSTGEVMGIDWNAGEAYTKSQRAAGNAIPKSGGVFVSLRDEDKDMALPWIHELTRLGFELYATRGTATHLYNHGVSCHAVYRISLGRPNLLDLLAEGKIQWIINTPESGASAKVDEIRMRSQAVVSGTPITTTVAGLEIAVDGLKKRSVETPTVCSLQEYHRHVHLFNENSPQNVQNRFINQNE